MKTYSIGRDTNCDIVVNDSTDVVSRRHALLNVMPSGKMTIIDQSSNGTYVNGIRISQNVPVPVTRKDTISFAHVTKLDWALVPKSNQIVKYVITVLIAIIVILGVVFGIKSIKSGSDSCDPDGYGTMPADTTAIATEKLQQDSIAKAKQDSIANVAKQDSIRNATQDKKKADKTNNSKQKNTKNKNVDKKETEQKAPETKPEQGKVKRVLG